jgi:hypothetical protein
MERSITGFMVLKLLAQKGEHALMHADEKAIVEYLRSWPTTFVSGREIAKKVGGRRRYEYDRDWAVNILAEMLRKGLLETDIQGYYRISQKREERRKRRFNRPVAPQILRILKSSGKSFEGIMIDDEEEDED